MTEKKRVRAEARRHFTVPPEPVFDAWIDPEQIGQWMFGPNVRDEKIVRLETDPRVGGKFSFVVRRKKKELDHTGEYLQVERPGLLAFTWGVPSDSAETSRITVEIQPLDTGSEVTVVHEVEPDFGEEAADAWARMLMALGQLLEGEKKAS